MKSEKPKRSSPTMKRLSPEEMAADMKTEGIQCWNRLLMEIPMLPMEDHLRRAKEICGEMCTYGSVRNASVLGFIMNYREFVAIHYRLARAVQPTGKTIKPLSPIAGAIVLADEKRAEHADYLLGQELLKLVRNDDLAAVKKIQALIKQPCETHRNYQIWVAIGEIIEEWDSSQSQLSDDEPPPYPDRADVQRWIARRKDPCFASMQSLDSKGWDRLWEDSGVDTGTNAFGYISALLGMDLDGPAFSGATPIITTAVLDPGVRGKGKMP